MTSSRHLVGSRPRPAVPAFVLAVVCSVPAASRTLGERPRAATRPAFNRVRALDPAIRAATVPARPTCRPPPAPSRRRCTSRSGAGLGVGSNGGCGLVAGSRRCAPVLSVSPRSERWPASARESAESGIRAPRRPDPVAERRDRPAGRAGDLDEVARSSPRSRAVSRSRGRLDPRRVPRPSCDVADRHELPKPTSRRRQRIVGSVAFYRDVALEGWSNLPDGLGGARALAVHPDDARPGAGRPSSSGASSGLRGRCADPRAPHDRPARRRGSALPGDGIRPVPRVRPAGGRRLRRARRRRWVGLAFRYDLGAEWRSAAHGDRARLDDVAVPLVEPADRLVPLLVLRLEPLVARSPSPTRSPPP